MWTGSATHASAFSTGGSTRDSMSEITPTRTLISARWSPRASWTTSSRARSFRARCSRRAAKKLGWFRYPFLATGSGETAAAVEEFLTRRGYRIAPVSVDYHDYSYAGIYARHLRAGDTQKAAEQFAAVLVALDGAFTRAVTRSVEVLGYELPQTLLIHCNEMNALTLRTTLGRIRDRGYRFVSMDEAMEDPAYKIPGIRPGGLGGGGLFNTLAAAKRGDGQRQ